MCIHKNVRYHFFFLLDFHRDTLIMSSYSLPMPFLWCCCFLITNFPFSGCFQSRFEQLCHISLFNKELAISTASLLVGSFKAVYSLRSFEYFGLHDVLSTICKLPFSCPECTSPLMSFLSPFLLK